MVRTLLLWAHPALGVLTVGLAVRAAGLGVRSRERSVVAARARQRHRALGPWVLGLVVVGWLGGAATVWLDRDDLELGASGHFTAGGAMVVLFALVAAISRAVPTTPWARRLHPWLGGAAILLAGVQVFLGLQLMPR